MTLSAPLETLLHPFDTGDLAPPEGRVLFVNAQAHPSLKDWSAIDAVQPFYPAAQGLTLAGAITPPYQTALVLVSKDKTAAQYELAQAFEALAPGGLLIASAANDANGNRLTSWFEDMGFTPHNLSKNKCRVVWARKDDHAITPFEWLMRGAVQEVEIEGDAYWSQPGLFGWDKRDTGSMLLADALPQALKGTGADFGCGYGYLTRQILARQSGITMLSADADKRAVDCCVKNNPSAHGVWTDLTRPWTGAALDWIVMNPPFHMGKMTDADIGLQFIATASGALKKGGWLYMVANRQLPYEDRLRALFARVDEVEQKQGFKVIFAQK